MYNIYKPKSFKDVHFKQRIPPVSGLYPPKKPFPGRKWAKMQIHRLNA